MTIPKQHILVRVVEKNSPIHGEPRGRYLQAAVPNEAGRAFGRLVMSFEHPYKVAPDALVDTVQDITRVLLTLSDRYEIGVYDPHA